MLGAFLAILLAIQSTPAQPRSDTRTWYQAYADAQRNIQQRNWEAAIADIEAASRLGAPKPGRNILFYGDVYRDFNPDYYLGVAYLNLSRYDDANRAFDRVAQAQLIVARDTLYAEFTRQATTVRGALEKQAASQRAVADPTQSGAPPAATLPPAPPPPVEVAANSSVTQTSVVPPGTSQPEPYAPSAQTPTQTPIQQPPVAQAPPRNPVQPAPANRAAPSAAAGVIPRATPSALPIPQVEERSALVDFFSGRYEIAANKLGALTTKPNASPRAYFYLACSRAALALTGKADATSTIANARAQLALAGDMGQFAADKSLISPRIQQTLGMQP